MPESKPKTQKTKSESSSAESEEKSTIAATGLEDYGRWEAMFKDRKSEGDRPFRRGRIWA